MSILENKPNYLHSMQFKIDIFKGIFFGILVGVLFTFIFSTGTFFLISIFIGISISIPIGYRSFSKRMKQEALLSAELLEQQRREELLRLKSRKDILDQLFRQLRNTTQLCNTLDLLCSRADRHITQAEEEFKEGLFIPFWEQVESATNNLATYYHYLHELNDTVRGYNQLVMTGEYQVPSIKLALRPLPDHDAVEARLYAITRKAQASFEFTQIYEQRKTNKLLFDGFTSLENAIHSVGSQIASAVDSLHHTIGVELSSLTHAISEQSSLMQELSREHQDFVKSLAENNHRLVVQGTEELWKKLDDQNRMLDNIQRRKRPGAF